jgi:hypothetical protein
MWMTLFLSIIHKLCETSPYFSEKYDATGHVDLIALLKCIADVRQLAYGMTTDTIDEYLKLGKSTTLQCLEYYCSGIIECFGAEFLRCTTVVDTQHLPVKLEKREFPNMLGA